MTTIHHLRASLDAAEANYRSADIEHPTAVHLAKEALTDDRKECNRCRGSRFESAPDGSWTAPCYKCGPRFGVLVS